MKKLEVSEQFVREAHTSACQTWRTRIEEEFPSLFEVKLEVGKWYYVKVDGEEFMFQRIKEGSRMVFGFNRGEWREPNVGYWSWSDVDKRVRLATPQEVESMLWKEAEKRGFKEGVRYVTPTGVVRTAKGSLRYGWVGKDNLYFDESEGLIYDCGKWSEILDPNKEIKEQISRLEKELKELKEKVK